MNNGKILLLSVGINNYAINPLKYCVEDAKLVFESYSKYNCESKTLLRDSEATKEEILKAIEDICSKARDNDYVIFSFAGHGLARSNASDELDSKNCFICPYKFDPQYIDITGISLYEINEKIKRIKSRHKLLLLDACHSGSALRRDLSDFNLRDIKSEELLDLVVNGSGNAIITACDSNEIAKEDPNLGHGIFTYSFNEILSNHSEGCMNFDDAYEKIHEKVKNLTNDEQHPKYKCDGENFTIPRIPKAVEGSKDVKLDLSLLPTPKETKIDNIDQFEEKIIHLIQTNRRIELDKTLKKSISEAYKEIEKLISPPHNSQKDEVLRIYESCRNQMKPINLIFDYLIEYGDESMILNNLDSIFSFEKLSDEMDGGLAAIRELPSALIAEIIFKLIGKAHKRKSSKIIRKFFTPSPLYSLGRGIPFVYDKRIWEPAIFHRDCGKFFQYLFPKENYEKDIIQKQDIKELCEIIFLIDSFSKTNPDFYSCPIYRDLDKGTQRIMLRKLSDKKYFEYINEIFNIDKNAFIDAISKRQKEMYTWGGTLSFNLSFNPTIYEEFDKLKEK